MSATRRTGATTQQMREAPQGATFVWCNNGLDYPRKLARFLGRPDIDVRPLSALADDAYGLRGLPPGLVVVDHAADRGVSG